MGSPNTTQKEQVSNQSATTVAPVSNYTVNGLTPSEVSQLLYAGQMNSDYNTLNQGVQSVMNAPGEAYSAVNSQSPQALTIIVVVLIVVLFLVLEKK